MEFVIGGLAATSAGVLTNPVEVVKHHMEISKKSQYTNNKYKSFFHTGFKVAQQNGVKSLQKGLSPALGAHLLSYGTKLGTYQFGSNRGLTTNVNGEVIVMNSVLMSAVGGVVGQYLSSPFYVLKAEHAMAYAADKSKAAVQKSKSYAGTAKRILQTHGLKGFMRGANASMPRAFIGTSQLTSFALAKENLQKFEWFQKNQFCATMLASVVAGIVLSATMTPFELVLNKLYNQALNPAQKAYDGFLDCMTKIYKANGIKPFFRGMGPIYLKLGPHTVFCLVFWEEFKGMYKFENTPTSVPVGKWVDNNFGHGYVNISDTGYYEEDDHHFASDPQCGISGINLI